MDEEVSSDAQKCISEGPIETDEGPLINENSNGLSHILTEGEFNSVDAAGVDESSISNHGFLNAVELSAESVDYLENNAEGFHSDTFDVGDNAVTFPSDTLKNVLLDGDSHDVIDTVYKSDDVEMEKSVIVEDITEGHSENETLSENINVNEEPIFSPVKEVNFDSVEMSEDTKDHASIDNIHEEIESKNTQLSEEKKARVNTLGKEETSRLGHYVQFDLLCRDCELNANALSNEHDLICSLDLGHPESLSVIDYALTKSSSRSHFAPKIYTLPGLDRSAALGLLAQETTRLGRYFIPRTPHTGGGAEETEVVSEDELPAVQKPSIKDAENVSDDELPGPRPAELPADTEVVSEDELPTSKKETAEKRKRKSDNDKDGYDPDSPTSESESSSKKQAITKNGESKPVPAEKRSSTDEKPKKKTLPELDKYWKVVNDDPTDFTGWTYLLQYVDQESDVEAAREAYDAFLSHYPYCYGYWRKYADYEKRKGSKKKCLEVLEKGLKSIPLSVDLWIHYLNHVKATRSDDHTFIRSLYERAIEACGLEFRSDRLWESYVNWEAENGSALQVTNIYDRLLTTPTLGYTTHFDNFQEHVMSEPVAGLVSREELVRLRVEVREAAPAPPPLDLPPGEDEPDDHIASEEEAQAIKERIVAARRKVHKATGDEVAARWTFEEGIKRPYFHVKPLERCQLKNWKAYLEWEKQHGSFKRALILHERCLIACALYEEFWLRLIKFLEEQCAKDPSLVGIEREVFERACTVHHHDKPELHLLWAQFEEAQGNTARAAEILERIEKACPNLVQIQYRRVNLERRRGDHDKCASLYENYISSAKNKAVASALSIKYARFLFHVKRDSVAARKVLDEAITRDPLNQRLYLQRLDLALHTPGTPYSELEELVQAYEKQEGAELEVCAELAARRRDLAEELGDSAAARAAHHHQRALAKHLRKRARKEKHDAPPPSTPTMDSSKKKEGNTGASGGSSGGASGQSTNSAYYQAAPAQYDQGYAQPYQPPWGYQQPPAPYQHHAHPWTQYPNYY
ncbi:Pre-mRNA-processing factor 39 [Eumeta japonica]|uniref:Pre-mRNA-processing factor 39 n=1 Tax=Eumeta variegata TaxID=151549 RepID=A0A4C1WJQ5_EUMVA|nr:Pre-mRNA-processing factor 39 [Eumeta japonica]